MFTELGGITEETGLSFDGNSRLYGYIGSYGTVVADIPENGEYRVDMFFAVSDTPDLHSERRAAVTELVNSLAEGLPRNTVMSQTCEERYVRVSLNKYSLLQENIIYLTEFLKKLAAGLGDIMPEGDDYKLLYDINKPQKPERLPADAVRVKLSFDLRSALGVLGAVAGAFAMCVIAILTVNVEFEINTLELRFEISTYILSAATAVVIFMDYRFIARKLDACGVIVCPVLTIVAVVLSGIGSGAKAFAGAAGVSFMTALTALPEYLENDIDGLVSGFMFGYISRGVILAAVASILICMFYFERHPDETVRSEKIVSKQDSIVGRADKK